jgi:hypothetical protein
VKILLDGVSVPIAYRSTSYVRFYHKTPSAPGQQTIQLQDGTKLSNIAKFSYVNTTVPYISYLRTSTVKAGLDSYAKGLFYVNGSRFKSTSKIYLDGKALATRYSSTTRLYVDEPLDFTKTTTVGLRHFEVRDGSVTSNAEPLRVETGISRLNRSRFTTLEPYVVSQNKKVRLSGYGSYLYSNLLSAYQVVVVGQGTTKTYPLTYVSGRYGFDFDTNGLKTGVYNVFVEVKATKIRSGGFGIVVIK